MRLGSWLQVAFGLTALGPTEGASWIAANGSAFLTSTTIGLVVKDIAAIVVTCASLPGWRIRLLARWVALRILRQGRGILIPC